MREHIDSGRPHSVVRHDIPDRRHLEEVEHDKVMGDRNILPESVHGAARAVAETFSNLWNRLPPKVRLGVGVTAVAATALAGVYGAVEFVTPETKSEKPGSGFISDGEGGFTPMTTVLPHLSPAPTPLPEK